MMSSDPDTANSPSPFSRGHRRVGRHGKSRWASVLGRGGLVLTLISVPTSCGCTDDAVDFDGVADVPLVQAYEAQGGIGFPDSWDEVDVSDTCLCERLCRDLVETADVVETAECELRAPASGDGDGEVECAGVAYPDGKCGAVGDPLGCYD